jgi:hypothetical protein
MTNDVRVPAWRDFAAWSAAGAIVYVLAVWIATTLLHQDVTGAVFRPSRITAQLGLGLLVSMAAAGFTNRKRPLSLRNLRNFLIQNALAIGALLLTIWGFSGLVGAGAVSVAEWAAAVTGATLIALAVFGGLAMASVRAGVTVIDDEVAADEMRERGRLFAYSFIWMAACGLLLIGLGLVGALGMLSPAAALVGALVLIAILAGLGIATWGLSDELARTLSQETGNMAFYLILLIGGGWAMLAHLGFVTAPAPLGWLTMFIVAMFVASFIVLGRRKLLRL